MGWVSKLNFTSCDWNTIVQAPEISPPGQKCCVVKRYMKGVLFWMYLPTLGISLTPISELSKHLPIFGLYLDNPPARVCCYLCAHADILCFKEVQNQTDSNVIVSLWPWRPKAALSKHGFNHVSQIKWIIQVFKSTFCRRFCSARRSSYKKSSFR